MITLAGAFLLTLLLITALGVVRARNLFAAAMLLGIFSLEMAAVFFLLDAVDVALTEASVGAGVATVLLLSALALTESEERASRRRGWLPLVVVGVMVASLVYASLDQPGLGDAGAPSHRHVAPWYLEETPRVIDVPNVVTAVLASFRGYDTLGELFVVFTAAVGVMLVLGGRPKRAPGGPRRAALGLRHHLIPRVVGRLLVPFIVLFGLYIQFHGDYGPGGGFQAGVLVAAALILHALLEGEAAALHAVQWRVLGALISFGALLYVGVGLAGIALGGNFLDYSVLRPDPVAGQHLGILLIELGVGMTVAGVMLSIYHAFAVREAH